MNVFVDPDDLLKGLVDKGILSTRVNRDTKEQEFLITDFGKMLYEILKGYVDNEKKN